MALQDIHDDGGLGAVETARIAAPVQFGEEFGRPFVVVIPQLFEQLHSKTGPRFDLESVRRRHDSIIRERGTFEVAVLGDDSLMMDESPQPGHINPVCRQIIHEPERQLVVIDRSRKVAVENLETVVCRHVERVLDVLDGDLTLRHAVDAVPQIVGEQFLRRVERILGHDPGRDLALGIQHAAGLQQAALGIHVTARWHRDWFAFDVHGVLRRDDNRLQFAQRGEKLPAPT